MNIRKKILFNPSNIKSSKPDTSDTTTAHTKNSAILDQSKTFRFIHQQTLSTRKQRNYLRTLSKDHKDTEITYNFAPSIKKRNVMIPSLSTMSNENFIPIKKSVLGRKFHMEQDELPSLVAMKRTDLMTSQQERKLFNYQSSVHVSSSNKDILNREQVKKQSIPQEQQQFKQSKPEAQMMILGQQYEEIERRKQKLNSLNIASFYTTQKSIALSKYSMKSRENHMESKFGSDKKLSDGQAQKDPMLSRFAEKPKIDDAVRQSPLKQLQQPEPEQELEESIVEEIQKNQSMAKDKPQKIKPQENSENEWSETLKSSYADSANKGSQKKDQQVKPKEEESSLCESEVINSQEVEEKKNTHRNPYKTFETESNPYVVKIQKTKQKRNDDDSEDLSLCESYQVETPQKKEN